MKRFLLSLFIMAIIVPNINAQLPLTGGTLTGPLTINNGAGTTPQPSLLNVNSGNITLSGFNYLKTGQMYFQYTNIASNSYVRGIIGQNIIWDPTTTQWYVPNVTNPDFSAIRMEASGQMGFYTHPYTTDDYTGNNITDANMQKYRRLTITPAGNVGIGTATPASTLEVNSGTANAASGLVLNQGTGSGNTNSSRLFFANAGDITTNSFSIFKNANNLAFSYGANPGSSSGTQAMVFTNTGNVGIGTNAPATNFEVYGPATTAQITWPLLVRNQSVTSATGYGTGIKLKASNDNAGEVNKWVGIAAVASDVWSNKTDFAIYTNGNASNSPTEKVRISGAGDVGIGTAAPGARLDVSSASNSSAHTIQASSPDNHFVFLSSSLGPANYNNIVTAGDQGIVFSAGTSGTGSFGIFPWTAASSGAGLKILANGNVGIGTVTPSAALDVRGGNVWINGPSALSNFVDNYALNVNGNIRANKLVVNTTGADFVFEPNYKLIPLNQLEKYVTTNRHLPGIETANVMQKDGVDVGENQTKLLQKVEELTLYIIDQNKALEQLRKEVEQLKASKK